MAQFPWRRARPLLLALTLLSALAWAFWEQATRFDYERLSADTLRVTNTRTGETFLLTGPDMGALEREE